MPALTTATLLAALTVVGAAPPVPARAPQAAWTFDPQVLVGDGRELLRRAPDRAVDALFLAVHDSTRDPERARPLCALFAPGADRSLVGLQEIAAQLSPADQERFAGAVAELFVAALQSPPQPYDEAAARQALKAAGVRAALVNDGFVAGLNGADATARCRSLRWLLEQLHARPRPERAAVTRLLLGEGLALFAEGLAGGGR